MAEAEINGAKIWYEVLGQGDPMLTIHGSGFGHDNFAPIVPYWEKDFQIIWYDMRGYGLSERPIQKYDMEVWAGRFQFDPETGRTLTSDFAQYEIPTSMDAPNISPLLVEEGEPTGPFGAKGVGEPGIVPTAPAIANAVYDAIGVQVKELPITAERVLDVMRNKAS